MTFEVGYWEPVNTVNTVNGPDNGHTAIGLVFPCEIKVETRLGHLLAGTTIPAGEPFTYEMGAGWSKSDVPTSKVMTQLIVDQSAKSANPLVVTVQLSVFIKPVHPDSAGLRCLLPTSEYLRFRALSLL